MTQTPDINTQPLAEVDPEIAAALADELGRQRGTLEMIASENFVPVSYTHLTLPTIYSV